MNLILTQIDNAGCGNYRIANMAKAINEQRLAKVKTYLGTIELQDVFGSDAVIFQRQASNESIAFARQCRARGIKVIYETDDRLECVEKSNPAYDLYKPGSIALENYLYHLKTADGVIVSTPELSNVYGKLNGNIGVFPNYIDYSYRDWNLSKTDLNKFRILYTGSSSHIEDVDIIVEPLRRILRKYENVEFAFLGDKKLFDKLQSKIKHKLIHIPSCDFRDYPKHLNADLMLIPLQINNFNKAKSSLKMMESLAKGIPCIATRIEPYLNFYNENNKMGGIKLVNNTVSAWTKAIEYMIENHTIPYAPYIREKYDTTEHAKEYMAVVKQLILR